MKVLVGWNMSQRGIVKISGWGFVEYSRKIWLLSVTVVEGVVDASLTTFDDDLYT